MTTPTEAVQPKKSPYVLIGIAACTTIVAGALVFIMFNRLLDTTADDNLAILQNASGATAIVPPRTVEDFTLVAHTGEAVSLSDLRGKAVLMSFGYTHCPDVCPLTLLEFAQVRETIGQAADDVQFVFISVDGERDTPERLARYLEVRDMSDFALGLTGTDADLRRLGVDYGLYFAKNTASGSAANYLVDHTASSFLIDQEGRLTTLFSFGTQQDIIAEEILALLS